MSYPQRLLSARMESQPNDPPWTDLEPNALYRRGVALGMVQHPFLRPIIYCDKADFAVLSQRPEFLPKAEFHEPNDCPREFGGLGRTDGAYGLFLIVEKRGAPAEDGSEIQDAEFNEIVLKAGPGQRYGFPAKRRLVRHSAAPPIAHAEKSIDTGQAALPGKPIKEIEQP
jgi:hypothetical protein